MTVRSRIAAVAFPASAVVILSVEAIQGLTRYEVPESASAAATGLLTWLAYVVLSAGTTEKR